MNNNPIEKPKNVDYFQMPCPLRRCIRRLLPKPKAQPQGGRPPADHRAVVNGIWYVLWTGCQWKAVHKDWFGVCSSTLLYGEQGNHLPNFALADLFGVDFVKHGEFISLSAIS